MNGDVDGEVVRGGDLGLDIGSQIALDSFYIPSKRRALMISLYPRKSRGDQPVYSTSGRAQDSHIVRGLASLCNEETALVGGISFGTRSTKLP
jgi:hypothetical protein